MIGDIKKDLDEVFFNWRFLGENAFFLERTDGLGAKSHGYFLSIKFKRLFLQIWFKDTIGAT